MLAKFIVISQVLTATSTIFSKMPEFFLKTEKNKYVKELWHEKLASISAMTTDTQYHSKWV